MVEGLSALITSQGWWAPAWYVAGFLLAALIPVIPTPLIAAIGGTAFGTLPAIFYGLVGLALGAGLALLLSRQLGRRAMRRLVPERVWSEWEAFLGVRSYAVWFVVFLILNLDVAVMAAGLSSLSARGLWATAMGARVPWLVVSAWAGERLLVNDAALVLTALALLPILYGVHRLRPRVRRWLVRFAERRDVANDGDAPS
ncbi:MAG: hypothetical protein RI554_03840 [Trueperaceae bacterium]|nr:hypothetical protein [Trueperaceae bacterium]